MTVLPEQLARLFFLPIGRERTQNKRANAPAEILCSSKLANASATRALMDTFFACTGTLFYILSTEEASELFRSVYMDEEGPTKAALGAICAIACVASQYDEVTIDHSVRQSYYETAKFYLDDCIEEDEVLGMRVLCLLSIYCAMDKRLTAWTWVLTGLKLARLRGIHLEQRPTSTSPEEWISQKKIMRTLIFLASWLSASLGSNPEIMAAFQPVFEESYAVAEDNPTIESLVQEQMTSIGVLTTGVLKDVFLKKQLSVVATREHKLKLAEWLSKIPAPMQLDSLTRNESLTTNQRRSVFLVHLDGDMDEALAYAEDAVAAALHSALLLRSLMSGRAIFKRCWLIIYQSFSACTVLLFHVAQKRLHGARPAEYEEELSHAESCLDTLEYCSQGDLVAKGYHEMLQFYYKALKTPPVNASSGTGKQSPHAKALGHTTMQTSASHGGSLRPSEVANQVGDILNWPYQHGWPSDRHEIISSVEGTDFLAGLGCGAPNDLAETTGLYYDSPIFGGPFQWSANTVPPPSRA
ncbi:hypothetical protein EDD36DRAFT_420102 [Exophiala viscosa]|uniref:Transcription factor domain-containing protein n=1 Tax=Exophiala viscosa TaxID=2486360 RepID=A0AAN6DT94_9EURO|nr:hypothetical protein EDD36DRAFT_420102 [Exophiala viscosa]